jgi:hypothetical protein
VNKKGYKFFTNVLKRGFPQKGSENNGTGRGEHFQASTQAICTRQGSFPETREKARVK